MPKTLIRALGHHEYPGYDSACAYASLISLKADGDVGTIRIRVDEDTPSQVFIVKWGVKVELLRPQAEHSSVDFNEARAVHESSEAETISAALYPNDNHNAGKTLRLTQQYFWCAASLSDIVRRFKKMNVPWTELPQYSAIQLNDTHPSIVIVELVRILVDEEDVRWDDAWKIVRGTFGYMNHTVRSI